MAGQGEGGSEAMARLLRQSCDPAGLAKPGKQPPGLDLARRGLLDRLSSS